MELYKNRSVDFQHKDERGSLTQLIHEGFDQINVVETRKGSKRGAHFHKESKEAFYLISGSVEVEFFGKESIEKVMFTQGDFFEIPPFVLHNMYFLKDCLMVQMYDKPVEKSDGSMDIYTEEEFNA